MTAYREIEEISHGTLEDAFSTEYPVYQVGFKCPEKIYQEDERCTRSNREDQRVLGTETENSRPVAQMGKREKAPDNRYGFVNFKRADNDEFGRPVNQDYAGRDARHQQTCTEPRISLRGQGVISITRIY